MFALWLEECCEKTPDGWESSAALFNSWKDWAASRNEPVGTNKGLAQALETKGFVRKPKSKARGFAGIRILQTATATFTSEGLGMGGMTLVTSAPDI